MREVRSTDYQFTLKPTWNGYVLMFRDSEPMNTAGDWCFSKWRKATWRDMPKFSKDALV